MPKQELNLQELADELDDLRDKRSELSEDQELDEDDFFRLEDLEEFEKEIGDLRIAINHGYIFIPEDEFKDYCQEEAFDCGYIKRTNCLVYYIDWQQYADDCSTNWNMVDFEGVSYYWRE